MKSNSFTTVILNADEGYYLTQADENTEIKDRIVAHTIAIGKYDSADNYIEIPKDEGDEIIRQQEELRKIEEREAEIQEAEVIENDN